MCREGRTGKICGSCKDRYSVYFHSPNYLCRENSNCSYGVLLYIVSELLPLTAIFVIILTFNIHFTSGYLNGFLFYAQTIDTLSNAALTSFDYSLPWILTINRIVIFVYRFFNLNFFSLDQLSFCLWEGANTLDIIIFKFVTITFAFLLVVAVFLVMNICTFKKCQNCYRKLSMEKSVIHGISTFLVTCFAQVVQVFFLIISPGFVYGKGNKSSALKFFTVETLHYLKENTLHTLYQLV